MFHTSSRRCALVRRELDPAQALIGFAGAPFTLAAYLVEGRPSRDFVRTKSLMYGAPATWHLLMDRLAELTVAYLRAQIAAGVDAVQLFDSWVGALSPDDYAQFVQPYMRRIFTSLGSAGVPMIHFGVTTSTLLGGDGDGRRQRHRPRLARAARRRRGRASAMISPCRAISTRWRSSRRPTCSRRKRLDILQRAGGRPGHIFNLGHGFLPGTPLDNAIRLAEFVRDESRAASRGSPAGRHLRLTTTCPPHRRASCCSPTAAPRRPTTSSRTSVTSAAAARHRPKPWPTCVVATS